MVSGFSAPAVVAQLAETGGTVPWWLVGVVAGAVVLGIVLLVIHRVRRSSGADD